MKNILVGVIMTGLLNCSSNKQVNRFFKSASPVEDKRFAYEQVQGLPQPVQRYFKYALPDGQPYLSYLRLQHSGTFKTGMDKPAMDIKGEQYFTAQPPGFVWIGRTKQFRAHDSYVNNTGNLSVYLFGLLRIVNSKGETIDQAELLRWLGESVWMPTNLLPDEHIQWTAIDDQRAKITFTWNGQTVYYIVHINEQGQITRMQTERYMDENTLQDWVGEVSEYREVDGMMVPTEIKASWLLEQGKYTYAHFFVDTFEYDVPRRFNRK